MSIPKCRNCGCLPFRFETQLQKDEFHRTGLCQGCQEAFPWDEQDEDDVRTTGANV